MNTYLCDLEVHLLVHVTTERQLVEGQGQQCAPSDHRLSLRKGLHYGVYQRVRVYVCWERATESALRIDLASLTVAPTLVHR